MLLMLQWGVCVVKRVIRKVFGLFCFSELVAPSRAVRAEREGSLKDTGRAELHVGGGSWNAGCFEEDGLPP